MKRKKILVINPISLFPKVMASQDRVLNMVKRLSLDHDVDLITRIKNEDELQQSEENLKGFVTNFFPIPAVNPANNKLKQGFYCLNRLVYQYFFHYPADFFYYSRKHYLSRISAIISRNRYDLVQVEYWYLGKLFEYSKNIKFKVIDTHDILFEKREQEFKERYQDNLSYYGKKYLSKYKDLETHYLRSADLVVCISTADRNTLSAISATKQNIVIPTGQDIDFFKNFKTNIDEKKILFYGSMGSRPNIDAFFSFYYKIFPIIKREVPDVKIVVVGANPPASIKKLHDNRKVIVTGYSEDVRPYLAQANFLILPLEVAAGFRSRVVDVMAMGIPVIGTRKALDSLDMQDGIHGFVTDSFKDMAKYAVQLLNDLKFRNKMSENCKKFVSQMYSIEATYGKLAHYYSAL